MILGLLIFGYGWAMRERPAEAIGVAFILLTAYSDFLKISSAVSGAMPPNPSPFGNWLFRAP
jgi:hypothetical protein